MGKVPWIYYICVDILKVNALQDKVMSQKLETRSQWTVQIPEIFLFELVESCLIVTYVFTCNFRKRERPVDMEEFSDFSV